MQIPGSVTQVTDSVAGRLEGLPLVVPGLTVETQAKILLYRKLTPVVYTSVQDSGVLLTIRYLTYPRTRRGTAQAMWEKVLDAFHEEASIDFAYPTQRVYLNPVEGKSEACAAFPPVPPFEP